MQRREIVKHSHDPFSGNVTKILCHCPALTLHNNIDKTIHFPHRPNQSRKIRHPALPPSGQLNSLNRRFPSQQPSFISNRPPTKLKKTLPRNILDILIRHTSPETRASMPLSCRRRSRRNSPTRRSGDPTRNPQRRRTSLLSSIPCEKLANFHLAAPPSARAADQRGKHVHRATT